MVERDGCNEGHLKEFDSLPFNNKLALVHNEYKEIECSRIVPGYENRGEVGKITDWENILGRKKYDVIDWVEILNNIGKTVWI